MLLKTKKRFTTTQMIAGGFMLAIIMGTLLLMLPISSKAGERTNVVDSLFTATTAICVTGLTTVVTAEHWNLFGQIVILILIQFGGLGVITFTTTILLALHKRITLKDRMLIQEAYNLDTLRGLVKLTIKILKGTFVVEGIGALLFATQFLPEFGLIDGLWKSIFHSISAFCNAGIDLIGATSFIPYQSNIVINVTTMILIILGGIGFPVWWDVITKVKMVKTDTFSLRKIMKKFELHTKIVITVTVILILFGAIFVFANEYSNSETIGDMPLWNKIMTSLFQSVTFRTAGYYTIPQEGLHGGTAFVGIILMFIGGSPSGTAGGVKTITVAMLLLAGISTIRGRNDVEVFHRKISDASVKKGLAVVMTSTVILFTATIGLTLVQDNAFIDILYEAASALATVGLSRDMTMNLTTIGKLIIIGCMYAGRIGPITMALVFNVKRDKGKGRVLPEEKIMVG